MVLLVAALIAGCGSDGGERAATATTVPRTTTTPPPAAEQSAAVALSAPARGDTLRATRDAGGTLHATVRVAGRATGSQTLRVQLSCPDRSCSRFVLTDGDGAFAVRMPVTLPATLSRLTVDVDYATIPDPQTVASVKVSVHRPAATVHARPGSSSSSSEAPSSPPTTTVPSPSPAPPVATIPASPSGATTPAGTRRTMTVIGDSLAVGMKPYLGTVLPGWTITVDGRVGRPLAEGMGLVRAADLPPARSSVLAISLFTNDDPRGTAQLSAAVDATLAEVGADGCVIWATIARDPVGGVSYAAANALLARKAASTPRLRLVDWAAYVEAHPGTLSAGNVHPGPAGYRARAALYAQAAAGCP
jgi:hypothetical protein